MSEPSSESSKISQGAVCGSGERKGSFNTPLHVGALVLILVLSTLACSFPIIVRRLPKLPVPHHVLFLSRHFGTGVLIATAFVHLLPTAFISLTDPCLPAFWNKGYPAMAGLIAMISVLVVVSIEMFFASRGAGHMHASEHDLLQRTEDEFGAGHGGHPSTRSRRTARRAHSQPLLLSRNVTPREARSGALHRDSEDSAPPSSPKNRARMPPPKGGRAYFETDEADSSRESDDIQSDAEESFVKGENSMNQAEPSMRAAHHYQRPRLGAGSSHEADMESSQDPLLGQHQERKLLLQCLLLEAGILFHSVFIGMALSVATGTSFIVLLVAISFHQTFEGLALGSRIAAIPSLSPNSLKPWLMALAYGTTTPIGQAIGLLVHNLYDPASQTGLLMVGIMNAISSGLLLFAGLVELLAEDFLSDKSYVVLQGRRRLEACGAVAAGGLLMALVGAWA